MSYDIQQDKVMYIIGLVFLGLFAIAGLIFYLNGDLLRSLMPPCVFYTITGYYCPGCGCTRAVYALFRGHIITSFQFNAFIPYVAIVGGWFMLSQTLQRVSRNRIKIGLHFRPIYAYLAVAVLLINWIAKNLIYILSGVHPM